MALFSKNSKNIFLSIFWVIYTLAMIFHLWKMYIGEISLFTTFLFYLSLGLFLHFITGIGRKYFKKSPDWRTKVLLSGWSALITIFGGELALRCFSQSYLSYTEMNGSIYYHSESREYRKFNRKKA